MTDLTNEEIQAEMDEAAKGDGPLKQIELVNRVFTIYGWEVHEPDPEKAKPFSRPSYIADVLIEGENERCQAWMGGKVMGAMDRLQELGLLPVRVKQVMEDKAYKLILVAANVDGSVPPDEPQADAFEYDGAKDERLKSALKDYVKEIGGASALLTKFQSGELPLPLNNALKVDAGVIVWKLSWVTQDQAAQIMEALTGKDDADGVPFE